MPEELPPDNKTAMAQVVGALGGALLAAGVEQSAAGTLWLGTALAILGLLLFWAGISWLRIAAGFQGRFARFASAIQRVSNNYRYRVAGVSLTALILALAILVPVWSVRKDLDTYVLPREVTPKQARLLRDYLAGSPAYSVTVKVNPLDQEALQFAGELLNAMHNTSWTVTLNTSNTYPETLNAGLGIYETGENVKPRGGKFDPAQTLQDALQKANIDASGGGGAAAGDYALFLVVGPRPLRTGGGEPMLTRLGNWISDLGQR